MLIAILENPSSAETLLNNLYEVDFEADEISLIMSDLKTRDMLTHDAGPLKGVHPSKIASRLIEEGLTKSDVDLCVDAIGHGKILVAFNVPSGMASVIKEMLQDHSAKIIKE